MKLAKNDLFRKMWQLPLESEVENLLPKSEEELERAEFSARLPLYRKMEDVELVLRFFAGRHLDKLKSSLDSFLDDYLRQANN